MRSLILTSLLALGLSPPSAGQEVQGSVFELPGVEIERVSWVGAVPEDGGVTVVNGFGDVRARFGGYEGRVELLGNVQHFADEGPRLVAEAEETEAGVVLTVGFRDSESSELVTTPVAGQKKRADLVVYVPEDAPLTVSTVDGLVDLRGLKSDVRANTTGGKITTRKVDGEVVFTTGSGDLLVVLEHWEEARRHSVTSGSGDLWLVFGAEVNARIEVETSGLISTDFSIELDYDADRRPIRRGVAMVGEGTSSVSLSSTDGHVRLRRRPLASKARVRPREGSE